MNRFSYRDDLQREEVFGQIVDLVMDGIQDWQSADTARLRITQAQVREAVDAYLLFVNEADDCDAIIAAAVPEIFDALDRSPTARSR
jgi:hypothetical protein